jgi:hypothetical protein
MSASVPLQEASRGAEHIDARPGVQGFLLAVALGRHLRPTAGGGAVSGELFMPFAPDELLLALDVICGTPKRL